jgi:hypothetical protein
MGRPASGYPTADQETGDYPNHETDPGTVFDPENGQKATHDETEQRRRQATGGY